jgi:hypothetical protein
MDKTLVVALAGFSTGLGGAIAHAHCIAARLIAGRKLIALEVYAEEPWR